jgi:hypothetical protein
MRPGDRLRKTSGENAVHDLRLRERRAVRWPGRVEGGFDEPLSNPGRFSLGEGPQRDAALPRTDEEHHRGVPERLPDPVHEMSRYNRHVGEFIPLSGVFAPG